MNSAFTDPKKRKVIFWGLFLILNIFFTGFLLPRILHGMDTGKAEISIEDLLKNGNQTGTSNLTVFGKVLDSEISLTTKKRGSTTTKYFRPMVVSNYESGDKIAFLLESDSSIDFSVASTLGQSFGGTTHSGILRDFLWEGPRSDVVEEFKNLYGFGFSEKVFLLDLSTGRISDFLLAVTVIGFINLFLFGLYYLMNS